MVSARIVFQSEPMRERLRSFIVVLAVAGIVISALALQVHYSTTAQLCDIGARQSCVAVGHSQFSAFGVVPVAAIGVVGYLLLALLAFFRRRGWTILFAWIGLGFAAYLSYVEAYLLHAWSVYCVVSQILVAAIALLAVIDAGLALFEVASDGINKVVKSLRYG